MKENLLKSFVHEKTSFIYVLKPLCLLKPQQKLNSQTETIDLLREKSW